MKAFKILREAFKTASDQMVHAEYIDMKETAKIDEARGPKLKVIVGKFKKEIAKFQKGGDLDYKAENALLAWALEYTDDIKTDDADEMDSWLTDNVQDTKAFAQLVKEYK